MYRNKLAPQGKKVQECLKFREARVFEYSQSHSNEVWVKYSLSPEDSWDKFAVEKKRSPGLFSLWSQFIPVH